MSTTGGAASTKTEGAATPRRALRVLHVIASMAAEMGGPPVVCAGLAGALAKRGHAVTIATTHIPAKGRENAVEPAGDVEVVSLPSQSSRYARSASLDQWLTQHVKSFDIVHLHSVWLFPTYAAARTCWHVGVPYVVLLNGMLDRYSVQHRSHLLKWAYWQFRESRIEGRSRGVHFLNQAEIRSAMPWLEGMPKFVVGNGISESELQNLPSRGGFRAAHPAISDRPLVLFLSRLHPKKGLDRLIPAWRALADKHPDVRFAIAGTGDDAYVAAIDQLIAQNGLADRVLRVGQLVGRKKWEALVDADVFVLPSHQEGFSMAITEALAAGCVPVATEECNFDELETEQCGVIVRGGNMPAFVRAVEELLPDAARRKRMGEVGAAFIRERFTWEKIAADVESVYRWILSGKPLPTDGSPVWRDAGAGRGMAPAGASAGV